MGDVSFQLVRFSGEFPDPGDFPMRQDSHHGGVSRKELVDVVEGLVSVE